MPATRLAVPSALVLLFCAAPLQAQSFPGFGGLEARIGSIGPEQADRGLGLAADLDLGGLGVGSLRVLAGLYTFGADVDRDSGAAEGDFSATGGRVALRFDPLGGKSFSPFFGAGLTGLNVSASVDDSEIESLLDGFYVGVSLLAGAAYDLDADGHYAAILELRKTFVSDVAHSAVELGLRWHPRARNTYEMGR